MADNTISILLSRQSGLSNEISVVAGNIANMNTEGYRRGALVFSEYVKAVEGDLGSLSMTSGRARFTDVSQGSLTRTDGRMDFALEGDGYFQLQTPDGPMLTRSGTFTLNETGEVVTTDGYNVLGAGGGPLMLPPDAGEILVGTDGSISVDGVLTDAFSLVTVENQESLLHQGGVVLSTDEPIIPAPNVRVAQGYLETSNVSPVAEMTRMIEVQRAYEMGQNLIQQEIERQEKLIQTAGKTY